MKKIWSFLLIVFGSGFSLSSSFVVSEIYSNSVGNKADKNKEWIEIANLSRNQIKIHSLGLEIYRGKKMELIFHDHISLSPVPVVFFDYLLIAQAKNLGLNHCLKREIPSILMPGFSLENDKEHHLCVIINDEERSCLTIAKNVNADGVAFFHDIDVLNNTAWLHEPCHLIDGIFATPGRRERACLNNANFKNEIFEDCQSLLDIALSSFEAGHSPKISSTDISLHNQKTATIKINFSDEDQDDLWWLFSCVFPKNSKKICYKTEAQRIRPNIETSFFLPLFSDEKDQIYFLLNDLHSSTKLLPTFNAFAHANNTFAHINFASPWHPTILEYRYDVFHIHLKLFIDESPLNISLLAADGSILDQRSFIERGEKNLLMRSDKARSINFSSPAGDSVIDLASLVSIPIRFSG